MVDVTIVKHAVGGSGAGGGGLGGTFGGGGSGGGDDGEGAGLAFTTSPPHGRKVA